MSETLEQVISNFEHAQRGIPQAHMAARLVAELRASLAAAPAQPAQSATVTDADIAAARELLADVHNATQMQSALKQLRREVVIELAARGFVPDFYGAPTPQADSQPALPKITAEDRSFLHDNPNTDDVVKWVQDYARAAISADRAARKQGGA